MKSLNAAALVLAFLLAPVTGATVAAGPASATRADKSCDIGYYDAITVRGASCAFGRQFIFGTGGDIGAREKALRAQQRGQMVTKHRG